MKIWKLFIKSRIKNSNNHNARWYQISFYIFMWYHHHSFNVQIYPNEDPALLIFVWVPTQSNMLACTSAQRSPPTPPPLQLFYRFTFPSLPAFHSHFCLTGKASFISLVEILDCHSDQLPVSRALHGSFNYKACTAGVGPRSCGAAIVIEASLGKSGSSEAWAKASQSLLASMERLYSSSRSRGQAVLSGFSMRLIVSWGSALPFSLPPLSSSSAPPSEEPGHLVLIVQGDCLCLLLVLLHQNNNKKKAIHCFFFIFLPQGGECDFKAIFKSVH